MIKKIFRKIVLYIIYYLNKKLFFKILGVKVGNESRIYIKDFGSEPFLISIGNRVTITHGVKLLTHDGSTYHVLDKHGSRYYKYGRINIGNNVFIGSNTIILPNVTITDNVIIGAGAVVTKDITKDGVYVGAPVKRLMSFSNYKNKIELSCKSNIFFNDYSTDIERYIDEN